MTCAHDRCICEAEDVTSGDKQYCSQSCAAVADDGRFKGDECPCGHPGCTGEKPFQ